MNEYFISYQFTVNRLPYFGDMQITSDLPFDIRFPNEMRETIEGALKKNKVIIDNNVVILNIVKLQ